MISYKTILGILILIYSLLCVKIFPQQVPDTSFIYLIKKCAYENEPGPVILIDGAHYNFHTSEGGFSPFAKLLRQDGYQVKGMKDPVSDLTRLNKCRILIIANALDSSNAAFENWALPNPSAFSEKEIANIKKWVESGGSLLLIADHMPFAGAAYDLAKIFGFDYLNGFAYTDKGSWPPSVFSKENKTLMDSPVTLGKGDDEVITKVATFTGSAFKIPPDAVPVLSFLDENYSLQPDTAWVFKDDTPKQNLKGYCQGALLRFGEGRVAVFGEAAMFTAQIANGDFKVGINSDAAPQNAQFALNLIHWLDRIIE